MKNLFICLIIVSIIIISGCSGAYQSKVTFGIGQDGNQAANNEFVGHPAGDHSTGNGNGYLKENTAGGFIKSFQKEPNPRD